MNFSDERYVRVFTRDTVTWKLLDWRARAVLLFMLRKADRAGVIDVGQDGVDGLTAVLELPPEIVAAGIEQLIARGPVVRTETAFVLPRFIEAQEAVSSDKQRAREYRERHRNRVLQNITERDEPETSRDESSRDVTQPSLQPNQPSVPALAVPRKEEERFDLPVLPGARGWRPRRGSPAWKKLTEMGDEGEYVLEEQWDYADANPPSNELHAERRLLQQLQRANGEEPKRATPKQNAKKKPRSSAKRSPVASLVPTPAPEPDPELLKKPYVEPFFTPKGRWWVEAPNAQVHSFVGTDYLGLVSVHSLSNEFTDGSAATIREQIGAKWLGSWKFQKAKCWVEHAASEAA